MPAPRNKTLNNSLSARFNQLDKETQEDILSWADWTMDKWAEEIVRGIMDGEYDNYLGQIVKAANHKMADVFAPLGSGSSSDDEIQAKMSRHEMLRLAGRIVNLLGLKEPNGKIALGVTVGNFGDIIQKHGKQYIEAKKIADEQLAKAKEASDGKAEPNKVAKKVPAKKVAAKKVAAKKAAAPVKKSPVAKKAINGARKHLAKSTAIATKKTVAVRKVK